MTKKKITTLTKSVNQNLTVQYVDSVLVPFVLKRNGEKKSLKLSVPNFIEKEYLLLTLDIPYLFKLILI